MCSLTAALSDCSYEISFNSNISSIRVVCTRVGVQKLRKAARESRLGRSDTGELVQGDDGAGGSFLDVFLLVQMAIRENVIP